MKYLLICLLPLSCVFSAAAQSNTWRYTIDSADVFSSPRFTDLNNDGVKDVVIGAGVEDVPISHGVVAVDGHSGELLWKVPSRTQIYTSALFQDITGDGVMDVFIGGRAASYFAIDGKSGEIIWEFWSGTENESRKAGYLNFFGTQWVDDQDGDGFQDLLVTNGGDYLAVSTDKSRPTARLMVLSSNDGSIVKSVKVPENRESYYAPHIIGTGKKSKVVFGTGGETVDGSLWEVPLKQVLKNSMKKSKLIVSDSTKGFILNSVVTDINSDGHADILNARMDATLVAVDGKSKKILWEHTFEGKECYVTPSLGFFTDDDIPDFFTIIATGTFPRYTSFELVVINGASGEIAWRETAGFNQFSPAAVGDVNGDDIDEIIFLENELTDPQTYGMENKLRVVDIKNDTSWYVGVSRPGISMASAPGIVDLDGDGNYEVVVATSSLGLGEEAKLSLLERIDLNLPLKPTWPGYLGPLENGILEKR
ncbi:hypothetical protein N9Y60_04010 [Crocinitomicaceae bacterium]|nr:hypothetical protein [Crocinitomicaceae bacterium]MDC0257150.1 hypothetical protein [Crocinitomicaceae bacterium]